MIKKNNVHSGMKVVLTKFTGKSKLHHAEKTAIGKMFSIRNVSLDGRRHNKYIAHVELSDGSTVPLQDIALCNENFEPAGRFIVCLSCNYHFPENELDSVSGISTRICPSCFAADCDSD
jgi:hypothetical protein